MALALIPVAYMLGTFPSAVMVAKAKGLDIHAVGSGNPGASNVARTMGTKYGIFVFLLDALKGAIPAAAGLLANSRPIAYALIAAAVIGHLFPVTRRLRGGKGAATFGGAIMVMFPVLGLILLGVWILVRRVSGTASLATLVILGGLIVGAAVLGAPAWEIATLVAIGLIVLARHTDNIKRLMSGRELSATRR